MSRKDFTVEVWQGGMMVASATASDLKTARREGNHYAMMYSQDGPIEIRERHPMVIGPQGRAKGGHARAKALSPKRRREIASAAGKARWASK